MALERASQLEEELANANHEVSFSLQSSRAISGLLLCGIPAVLKTCKLNIPIKNGWKAFKQIESDFPWPCKELSKCIL